MKKLITLLVLSISVVMLTGCGNNPKNKFDGKTYYVEPVEGGDSFLLEFKDEKYVELIYPQFGSEIGTYIISDEKYDGMYHIKLNIDELGHDDYLFDNKNMQLIGVDPDDIKLDMDNYEDYHLQLEEYKH